MSQMMTQNQQSELSDGLDDSAMDPYENHLMMVNQDAALYEQVDDNQE